MTAVALVSGGWGQNIGNAFFNLGGQYVLGAAIGQPVRFIQDDPAYWTFRNQRRGSYQNAFDVLEALQVDLVVLQGPLFTETFPYIWRERLKRLRAAGTRWAVLSGAFRRYNNAELRAAEEVLRAVPPEFLLTRDSRSAELLRSTSIEAHEGIDSAFFLADAVPRAHLRPLRAPIVTFCFDHFAEPDMVPDAGGPIEIGDKRYRAHFGRVAEAFARRGKGWAYASRPLDRRRLPGSISGVTVVRPEHRTNPHIPLKIYQHVNGVASDEPWTYLALYSTTSLTFTDRVHACVATLAYGRAAMLHNPTTRRGELFKAVGASEIFDRPVRVDSNRLMARKDEVLGCLKAQLGG